VLPAPEMVAQPTAASWTPLHLAIKYSKEGRKEELILKLIHAWPPAVECQLQRGLLSKTPFHLACEANASAEILKAMLEVRPTLSTTPYVKLSDTSSSEYPLFILWEAIDEKGTTDDWSKMEILLRAATHYPLGIQSTTSDNEEEKRSSHFDVLRACCQINPVPREYLQLNIQRYQHRLAWSDNQGWLHLHHAIQSSNEETQSYTEFLLESLLQKFPAAASVPFEINYQQSKLYVLPLHVLITDRRMTWHNGGVRAMVNAYPDALWTPDPRNGLVPFLGSATNAMQSRAHLSTTYELLRKSPDVIESYCLNIKSVSTGW